MAFALAMSTLIRFDLKMHSFYTALKLTNSNSEQEKLKSLHIEDGLKAILIRVTVKIKAD